MLKHFTPKITFCFSRQLICFSSSSSSISYDCSDSSDYMSRIVSRIVNSRNPREALNYFDSVKDQINVMNNRRVHSTIVHVLSRAKWYLEARCLLKCLIKDLLNSCTPRRVSMMVYSDLSRVDEGKFSGNVFGILMIALCEMGLVDEAVWVYRKVGELPSVQSCNALLNGLVKLGRDGFVWEMYNEMVDRGLAASVHTYGTLIDACGSDTMKSRKLFDEMVGKGIKPTVVIFTTLIRGLCNESKMSDAEDLFREMKESSVLPNLYTYNTLMDGHCKMVNLRRALGLFREMLDQNPKPNVVTFGILVDAFCKDGRLDVARAFFPCMVKAGVPPNVFVYNSLFDGLCKAGNFTEALALYVEMGKLSVLPDVFTYTILVKGLSEVGRVTEADHLLLKMKNEGIPANSVTYNSLIDSHCKQGNIEKALRLYSLMGVEGIKPNALTFSAFIHGYCRDGKMEAARCIYREMIMKGITPDVVTYTDLMNGYFKNDDKDAALVVYREMQEAGVIPNAFTVCCLIDGLCKYGMVNDAVKRFLEFTSSSTLQGNENQFDIKKFPVNHIAYTALICGLCKEGRILKASKFFSDMRACGLRADRLTYRIITFHYSHGHHVCSLRMLQADMLKLGFLPDKFIYPFLYRAYLKMGDEKSALRCSEDLTSLGLGPQERILPLSTPV